MAPKQPEPPALPEKTYLQDPATVKKGKGLGSDPLVGKPVRKTRKS